MPNHIFEGEREPERLRRLEYGMGYQTEDWLQTLRQRRLPAVIRLPLWAVVVLLCAQPMALAEDLWEWVIPKPQGHSLFAIAAAEGVIVAVGYKGTVLSSTDGVRWGTRLTGGDHDLLDVVWGSGTFVAVGGTVGEEGDPGLGVILASEDGFEWTEVHQTPRVNLGAVAWNGSRFVALGNGRAAFVSDDGFTWTEHPLEPEMGMIWDVTSDGSRFVAVGRDGFRVSGASPKSYVSHDGVAWTAHPIMDGGFFIPDPVFWTGDRFVGLGDGTIFVSTDGEQWTELPDGPEVEDVTHGDGVLLGITTDGGIAMSPDGIAWSIGERVFDRVPRGVAWVGDHYIAVGGGGGISASPDGEQWEEISSGTYVIPAYVYEMAEGDGTFVGVGRGPIVASTDGVHWSRTSFTGELWSVIRAGDAFWAVGDNVIVTSVDGLDWQERLFDHDLRLFDIVWNGEIFVAVGWNPSVGQIESVVLTSRDGLDWAYHWLETETVLWAAGWTGGQFVVFGNDGARWTSTNGEEWLRDDSILEDFDVKDLAWDGRRLVAVGDRHDGAVVMSSENGLDWIKIQIPGHSGYALRDVTWTGTHFVAAAPPDGIVKSRDGVSWSAEPTDIGVGAWSVVGDRTRLFAAGVAAIIRRTAPLSSRVHGPARRRPPSRGGEPIQQIVATRDRDLQN